MSGKSFRTLAWAVFAEPFFFPDLLSAGLNAVSFAALLQQALEDACKVLSMTARSRNLLSYRPASEPIATCIACRSREHLACALC